MLFIVFALAFRRVDREVPGHGWMCTCHFVDGIKENGSTTLPLYFLSLILRKCYSIVNLKEVDWYTPMMQDRTKVSMGFFTISRRLKYDYQENGVPLSDESPSSYVGERREAKL